MGLPDTKSAALGFLNDEPEYYVWPQISRAGTVRLGKKVASSTGGTRPVNLDDGSFNLTDAPELATFIGQGDFPKTGIPCVLSGERPWEEGPFFQGSFCTWASNGRRVCGTVGRNRMTGHLMARCEGDGVNRSSMKVCPWTFDLKNEQRPPGVTCEKQRKPDGTILCRPHFNLYFMVPGLNTTIPHMLTLKGWYFVRDIMRDMRTIQESVGTSISGLPLVLYRAPRKIEYKDVDGKSKNKQHWGVRLRLADHITQRLAQAAQILVERKLERSFAAMLGEGPAEAPRAIAGPTNPIAHALAEKQDHVDRLIDVAATVVPQRHEVETGPADNEFGIFESFNDETNEDIDIIDVPEDEEPPFDASGLDDHGDEPEAPEIAPQEPEKQVTHACPPVPQGEISICKECGAETWWGMTANEKRIRIDADPVDKGTHTFADGVVKKMAGGPWTCHFDTCGKKAGAPEQPPTGGPSGEQARAAVKAAYMKSQDRIGGDRNMKAFAKWVLKNFEHRMKDFASIPDDVAVAAALELGAHKGEGTPWG